MNIDYQASPKTPHLFTTSVPRLWIERLDGSRVFVLDRVDTYFTRIEFGLDLIQIKRHELFLCLLNRTRISFSRSVSVFTSLIFTQLQFGPRDPIPSHLVTIHVQVHSFGFSDNSIYRFTNPNLVRTSFNGYMISHIPFRR